MQRYSEQSDVFIHRFLVGMGDVDDWVLVEDGDFKGLTVLHQDPIIDVVYLGSRFCSDGDRWKEMPSLRQFQSLKILDLHKSRYIPTLHESIGGLRNLQHLLLTRCKNLRTLPPTIGNLQNLTEVRRFLNFVRPSSFFCFSFLTASCWFPPA